MAATMAICAVVGLLMQALGTSSALDDGAWIPLMGSAALTAAAGAMGLRWGRGAGDAALGRRDATLAVALIWLGAGVFGGLPFVLGAGMSPADAFFEAISGFTTTGATIVVDIEGTLSRPLLLWRSVIQWLGGMGIVVLFVAVFPNVGVGGKHMFRSEVPGPTAEGLQPRITETSITLWGLYAAFTVIQVVVMMIAVALFPAKDAKQMDLFEAVCHAMTTMSTGGFSTRNASVGGFNSPAIELIIAVFMLIAGVNFGLYYGALRRRSLRAITRSTEFRVYAVLVVGAILMLAVGTMAVHDNDLGRSLRLAVFTVATTVTSTGYGVDDYMAFPSASLMVFLLLMFVGGMSGSTAGGIKVSRIVLLAKSTWAAIRRSVRPSVVQVVRMSGRRIHGAVLTEVAVFFFVYMAFMGGGTLFLAWNEDIPVGTAFGATLTSLSNMGPAPFYLGEDNFASYTDIGKVICSLLMVLGRLEFFALLALLLPDFWRR